MGKRKQPNTRKSETAAAPEEAAAPDPRGSGPISFEELRRRAPDLATALESGETGAPLARVPVASLWPEGETPPYPIREVFGKELPAAFRREDLFALDGNRVIYLPFETDRIGKRFQDLERRHQVRFRSRVLLGMWIEGGVDPYVFLHWHDCERGRPENRDLPPEGFGQLLARLFPRAIEIVASGAGRPTDTATRDAVIVHWNNGIRDASTIATMVHRAPKTVQNILSKAGLARGR